MGNIHRTYNGDCYVSANSWYGLSWSLLLLECRLQSTHFQKPLLCIAAQLARNLYFLGGVFHSNSITELLFWIPICELWGY